MPRVRFWVFVTLLVSSLLFGAVIYKQVVAEDGGSGSSQTLTPTPTPNSTETKSPTPTPTTSTTSGDGSLATPTSTPSSSDSSSSGTSSTTDRLAQVGDPTLSCIKTILTSSEIDRLRFLLPTNDSEEKELESLKSRVSVCFQTFTNSVKISEGGSKISFFPSDTKDCLEKQIGETEFDEINSGNRLPTIAEKVKADSCFSKEFEPVVAFQTKDSTLSKEIESCLVLALGSKKASDVKKRDVDLSLSDRLVTERCFGASVHPLQKTASFKVPEKVNSCLSSTLGEDRAKELENGHISLTEKEKTSGKKCFDDLNKVQERLLPPPPQKVPFIDESSIVKVTENSDDKATGLSLSGKALPGALVDIFVFSEPIVVSTEADANGDWVYKMSDPVSGGDHIAYAVAKDNSGRTVRSSIYNFTVLAAEETGGTSLLPESKATLVSQNFILYGAIVIVAVLIIVGIVIVFLIKRKNKSTGDTGGASSGIGSDVGTSSSGTGNVTSTSHGQSENKVAS